jgi:aspartate-semialdehyde dehydrogenase
MRQPCAVLGATGMVGQRFVERLAGHPMFSLHAVTGSERSQGKRYAEVDWVLDTPRSRKSDELLIADVASVLADDEVRVVFSALPGGLAGPVERQLAAAGKRVFTNARDLRMQPDVPLLIPEVNPDHLELAWGQDPSGGFVVANGNCAAIVATLALAPVARAYGIERVEMTTLQSLSGAGHPGVSGLDAVGNVIPYIAGEEDKLQSEPQKTLGQLVTSPDGARITPADFRIRATATRVPVREGHMAILHVHLRHGADSEGVTDALSGFVGPPELRGLPGAPKRPLHVMTDERRPQPLHDVGREEGMAVSVGRIQVDGGGKELRMVALGANTVRGAAGQSLLNAAYAEKLRASS